MPTIEIVSVNCKNLQVNCEDFKLSIIKDLDIVSHRSLFQQFLKKHKGAILHIGNPEFKTELNSGFFAGDIIDWEFDKQNKFKFKQKYKPELAKLMALALEKSKDNQVYFLTDIQIDQPNPKYRNINSIEELLKLHEIEGLEWNTLYSINTQ